MLKRLWKEFCPSCYCFIYSFLKVVKFIFLNHYIFACACFFLSVNLRSHVLSSATFLFLDFLSRCHSKSGTSVLTLSEIIPCQIEDLKSSLGI